MILIQPGKFRDLDPKSVTLFQTKIVDISLNIARTDLYQPPKWSQFCLDYDYGIKNFRSVLKNDVKLEKRDKFWIKILELSTSSFIFSCS